jgi:hypothetical protein
MAVHVITASTQGCLNDYSPDDGDPTIAGICDLSFDAGDGATLTDITHVSGTGTVAFTNESGGTVGVSATVFGYYQDYSGITTGETYVPVAQQNVGSQTQSIPAGGQITVQVAGQADIPAGAVGAALSIGAKSATAAGFISAWPAGGASNSAPLVTYQASGATAHGVYQGNLSASGQVTLLNTGTSPVTVTVGSEGYFLSPTASPAGSSYAAVAQAVAVNTGDGTGGVTAQAVPANSSITFPVEGVDDVPTSGVSAVVEDIRAYEPQDNGFLSVYAAGGTDPGQPGVNFSGGMDEGNNLTIPMVSTTGEQTITNHSSGTVQVIVALRGFFVSPATPPSPDSVTATVSGQSATVTWTAPATDGGSPITGYTVTASPDNATVSVGGGTTQATLGGLANAAADSFSVVTSNSAGASEAATYAPPNVISGTVLAPSGQPVSGAAVGIYPSDVPASDPDSWTPSLIGTATTDANGIWTYTVPQYSALPADAQADANSNGGYLNVDASATGAATVGTTTYDLGADTSRSAWVGTASQPSGPVTAGDPTDAPPAMTLTPDQTDLSSLDTTTAEDATPTYQDSPTLTDGGNDMIGDPDNAYLSPPADSYGYQTIAGSDNNYDPYTAADGTNLSTAQVTGITPGITPKQFCSNPSEPYEYLRFNFNEWKPAHHAYTVIGEYHVNWDGTGGLTWSQGASASIGTDVSEDGDHFGFDFYTTYDKTSGSNVGPQGAGPYDARQVKISLNYNKIKSVWAFVPASDPVYPAPKGQTDFVCKTRWFIQQAGLYAPPAYEYIRWDGPSIASHDGDNGWLNDFPNSYYYSHPYGAHGGICASSGTGFTYGWAVSLGGIGIREETEHSTDTEQCDSWGSATRHDILRDKKDNLHWAWGSNKSVADDPKIFYNY